MELVVQRRFKGPDYTIGSFFVDDEKLCDTLEHVCRIVNNDCSMKIFGETAIPEGRYQVEILWWDKHQNYYPHVMNVPCFEGILIHGGLTASDSEGCILVGENTIKGELTNGPHWARVVTGIIQDALKNEEVWITIK